LRGDFIGDLLSNGRDAIDVMPEKGGPMKKVPVGYREVFCRFIRKNGKIIYPKNGKVFHFYVKA